MKGHVVTSQLESPPTLDVAPAWIADRRAHLVREMSVASERHKGPLLGSRRLRLVLVAAAIVLLTAGAALATKGLGFDVLPWLESDDPSEATYFVDTTRTVTGAFPMGLVCPAPNVEGFSCAPGDEGRFVYELLFRIEADEDAPEFTREGFLVAVAEGEQQGTITPEMAQKYRTQIAAVRDDFFVKFGILSRIQTTGVSEGRVPPPGIPILATCERAEGGLACRSLAGAVDVPVGAPVYALRETDEWVKQPPQSKRPPAWQRPEVVAFWNSLTPAEQRLWTSIMTDGVEEGATGESGPDAGPRE
jgi:hypothetical protein